IRSDLEESDDFGAFLEIFGVSTQDDHRARPSQSAQKARLVSADLELISSPIYKITPGKYMPNNTRCNKENQLQFSSDPASLKRSIRKGIRSSSIDNNTTIVNLDTSLVDRHSLTTVNQKHSSVDRYLPPDVDRYFSPNINRY
ncbi:hypothetical protein IGI04_007396, partial [Brassica rapa subsp. trilocularis]